eukprot:TRINITY_DN3618_c0_g2_i1.p1 TRINITY_DN3618_c0_g2~~TRINITY_DN3618_c0_g2_i1.p1  ORF type:complete len:662 (-),score=33.05 TRINITY_DN3618_c0_g2_i1:88-2073(-)
MGKSRRWRLLGLGHCPLRFPSSFVSPPGRARSLRSCLRRCEVLGSRRCRFVSYVDADVLRKAPAGGACHVAASCPSLQAITAGAVTYYLLGKPKRRLPRRPEHGQLTKSRVFSATIAVASPFDATSSWCKQICAGRNRSAVLRSVCRDPDAGLFNMYFNVNRFVGAAEPVAPRSELKFAPLYIRHRSGAYLCADGGHPHFSLPCRRSLWHVVSNFNKLVVRLKTRVRNRAYPGSNNAEAGVWLRLDGSSLYLGSLGNRLVLAPWQAWNTSRPSTRWHVGFHQPFSKEMLHPSPEMPSFDVQDSAKARNIGHDNQSRWTPPQVWLLATKSYTEALARISRMFHRARDAATVHVRWAKDLRNVSATGFSETHSTGRHVFARFFYLRMLLIFEALLYADLAGNSIPIFTMDLDIGVYSGWARELQSCVLGNSMGAGERFAHACFMQQPHHDVEAFQLVNAGLWVLRGGSFGSRALAHSLLARLHSMEIRMLDFGVNGEGFEHDQMSLNALLHRVRDEGGLNSLRWAVYNPSVVYVGTFLSPTPLSLRLYHATSSVAKWSDKLCRLKQTLSIVSQVSDVCPSFRGEVGRVGASLVHVGPLNFPCLYFSAVDPHFGSPIDVWRMYTGFGVSDALDVNNLPIIQHFGRQNDLDDILSRRGRVHVSYR